jgi:hypothetical protein
VVADRRKMRVTRTITIINQRRSTGWVVDGHSQGQLAVKLTNRLEGENQSVGISNVVSIKEGSMHQSTTKKKQSDVLGG